jgi:uncharacterized repeat protein (TIGR01451 family)
VLLVASTGWLSAGPPPIASAEWASQPTPPAPPGTPVLPIGVVDRGGSVQRVEGTLSTRAATTAETLAYLNALRVLGNLPPLAENAAWSDGATKHSRYVVLTGTLVHDELDGSPYWTPEGDAAGNNSNVQGSTGFGYDERDGIDGWMLAPFHGVRMVDPGWTTTGFGVYRKQPGDPTPSDPNAFPFNAAATLDVLRGRADVFSSPLTSPVLYPRAGGVTGHYRYPGTELPDPLQTNNCLAKGFGGLSQTGAPIYLLLGGPYAAGVTLDDANTTVKRGGVSLEYCRITADDGSPGLAERNAIILMPKDPLTAGTYDVSVRAKLGGGAFTTYAWSFTVAPPDVGVTSSHSGSFQVQSNATYTLTVQNAATASPVARSMSLVDVLPPALTFVSASGDGWSCSASNGHDVFCNRNLTLAPGASTTVTLTVAVGDVAPQTVTNTASVSLASSVYTLSESNQANNTSTDATQIVAPSPCSPRPRVQVSTSSAGSGRIQVVVKAGLGQLQQMSIGAGARSVANALVDLPGGVQQGAGAVSVTPGGAGQVSVGADTSVSFTSAPAEYTFFVRRAASGAATVPLVLTDACGEWPSFVGMGAGVP